MCLYGVRFYRNADIRYEVMSMYYLADKPCTNFSIQLTLLICGTEHCMDSSWVVFFFNFSSATGILNQFKVQRLWKYEVTTGALCEGHPVSKKKINKYKCAGITA